MSRLQYKHRQTQAEALELTYSHLGRLMQSAEMLAFKLDLIKNSKELKYQSYDYYRIANKKDTDTIKYDVINFLDFYEKAIQIHEKEFNYVHPKSIETVIYDLENWRNKASDADKRFFSNILNLIEKKSYNPSDFYDENELYEKANKDTTKFKKNAGFWKTMSVPVLQFLSNLTKSIQEKVKMNPNFIPDLHYGNQPVDTNPINRSHERLSKEFEISKKLNEINEILFKINNGQNNENNMKSLVNSVNEFNLLYNSFKTQFGDIINLDTNSIEIMKQLISKMELDTTIARKLKNLTIDLDPKNEQ
jgi:hypothetical protein